MGVHTPTKSPGSSHCDERRSRRSLSSTSPRKPVSRKMDEDGGSSDLRRLRKRNLEETAVSKDPKQLKIELKKPRIDLEKVNPNTSNDLNKEKRPPVKLTVKLKDGKKPCQVRVINSSLTKSEVDLDRVKDYHEEPHNDPTPVVVKHREEEEEEESIKSEKDTPPAPPKAAAAKPLSVQLSAQELVRAVERLGYNGGDISTSIVADSDLSAEELMRDKNFALNPPKVPKVPLTKEELNPPTPCVYVKSKEEAFSPQLFELCLQRPIVVIRNLAPILDIDMSLYGTKTLVEMHPNHPVEIRNQVEQCADENWDSNFEKQVWYCTSSRSHSTIAKYAEYQAATLEEAYLECLEKVGGDRTKVDMNKVINPPEDMNIAKENRKYLKFGTNCDLSNVEKWRPQLEELDKLPAWARVVSAGNMLSHLDHQILGMNTVQLYMKVPRARTPGHQENNNFCAINLNVGPGDSEWFGVPNDYWGGLQAMCKKANLDYLHGSWWPRISELHEAGIPVYRFMQKPGDLVWVNTGCVHWVQAAGWCNNIAWNVGPLTAHQYQMAIERYEWNKTQKYQSIVAMVFLTWNLARNVQLSNLNLYWLIRRSLMQSIRQIVQTLNFVRSKGVKVRFHGHRAHESAHYCGVCDEEVFNVLLIKDCEKRHVVHCLRCAKQPTAGGKDLKGIIALVEYPLKELLEVYDNFVLVNDPEYKSPEGKAKS